MPSDKSSENSETTAESLMASNEPTPHETETTPHDSAYEALAVSGEKALQYVEQGDVSAEVLTDLLTCWKYSIEKKEDIIPLSQAAYAQQRYWTNQASKYSVALSNLVGGDFLSEIPEEVNEQVNVLAKSDQFTSKALLADYLAFRIAVAYDYYQESKSSIPDPEGVLPPRPFQIKAKTNYEHTLAQEKNLLMSCCAEVSTDAPSHATLRRVFENLQDGNAQELADSLLLSPELTPEQRVATAVEYINVYGFIPTIEAIAPTAKTRPEIKKLYETLQGDTVVEVMKDLWEVYQTFETKADFGEYYQDEITKTDLALVGQWGGESAKRFGKEKQDLNVMSLAAGKGRMAFAMEGAGYSVVAVEPQQNYVEAIEQGSAGRNIQVVQKTWNELVIEDLPYPDSGGVELGESTGRNLPHGNSPQRLLEAFDAIRSVSKEGAVWVVDFMSPHSGRYERNITHLRENLLQLGVDSIQANYTFEGPGEGLKFNRVTVSTTQMEAYSELMGLSIKEVVEDKVGEGAEAFTNVYYVLEVNKDYAPENITPTRLHQLLIETGLYSPGVDLNEHVKAWDMSIGQALLFGLEQPDNLRQALTDVRFIRRGRSIDIQSKYRNSALYPR
jgi:hypothetical protein